MQNQTFVFRRPKSVLFCFNTLYRRGLSASYGSVRHPRRLQCFATGVAEKSVKAPSRKVDIQLSL